MEEGTVASVLVNDFATHATALEFFAFLITATLAAVGSFLAVRAYAILSDARALYWRNYQIEKEIQSVQASDYRRARAGMAAASASRRKKPARRNKTVI